MRDYLKVVYSESRRPNTDYPSKLAAYIQKNMFDGAVGKLVDIGCGKGDMLREFSNLGYSVSGVDISLVSKKMCSPHPVEVNNLEVEPISLEDSSAEFIFSKSVIEHLHSPLNMLKESHRLLEQGGKVVILTPSWMHHGWGPFYIDFTHVTPFTAPSLRDAMLMAGYKNVEVKYFHQLPFLWSREYLTPFVRGVSKLPIPYSPVYDGLTRVKLPHGVNKFVRFSKEVMLLAVGEKR